MILHLAKIEPDQPQEGSWSVENRTLPMQSQEVRILSMTLHYHVETKRGSFPFRYRLSGTVQAFCERCGDPMAVQIDDRDSIVLTNRQPTAGHVVLDDAELDTVFLKSTDFDLDSFLNEAVDLALPSYLRHMEEADCRQDSEWRGMAPKPVLSRS